MKRLKYIRTKISAIIVFSEMFEHAEFKEFEPVSAGFIKIGKNSHNQWACVCYGESVSLNLKSDSSKDSRLAKRQIFGSFE